MKTYAGIDLHSSNNYIGVIDAKDKRLYSKRHANRIERKIGDVYWFITFFGVVGIQTYKPIDVL